MSTRLRLTGVSRLGDNKRVILLAFDRRPTDDELRDVHEALRPSYAPAPPEEPARETFRRLTYAQAAQRRGRGLTVEWTVERGHHFYPDEGTDQ